LVFNWFPAPLEDRVSKKTQRTLSITELNYRLQGRTTGVGNKNASAENIAYLVDQAFVFEILIFDLSQLLEQASLFSR
jgi:hypothetical protein